MVVDAINARVRKLPNWPLYILGALPIIYIYYMGLTGQLGPDPAKKIEHQLGLWSLQLVILGLTITPLMRFTGLKLIKLRRPIGVLAFFYVLVHLLTWLFLDVQWFSLVMQDIAKRPYITIGMLAFVLMLPLYATSNDWSVRKLGAAAWQRIHRLTYIVAILGALHFVMLAKGFQLKPLIYLAIVAGLLGLRFLPKKRRQRVPA